MLSRRTDMVRDFAGMRRQQVSSMRELFWELPFFAIVKG